jgi:hypothetical protein
MSRFGVRAGIIFSKRNKCLLLADGGIYELKPSLGDLLVGLVR